VFRLARQAQTRRRQFCTCRLSRARHIITHPSARDDPALRIAKRRGGRFQFSRQRGFTSACPPPGCHRCGRGHRPIRQPPVRRPSERPRRAKKCPDVPALHRAPGPPTTKRSPNSVHCHHHHHHRRPPSFLPPPCRMHLRETPCDGHRRATPPNPTASLPQASRNRGCSLSDTKPPTV